MSCTLGRSRTSPRLGRVAFAVWALCLTIALGGCLESGGVTSDTDAASDAAGADAHAGGDGAADVGDAGPPADPGGPRYWLRSYGGVGRDELRDVLPEPDGGAWLLGTTESAGAGGWDAWLLRVDACGAVQSAATLGGKGQDQGVALGRLSGGDLLLVGSSDSFERSLEVWVTRWAPTGSPVYSVAVGGSGWDAAVAATATTDDGAVVLGETYNFGPGAPKTHNLLVFALDGAGQLRWEQTLGGGKDGDAGFGVLRADAAGGVVVIGASESYGAGRDDIWLIRLDAQGAVQWARTYGGEEDDEGRAIWHDGSGGFWLTGFTRGFDAKKSDTFTLHVDGDGWPLQMARYGDDGKERGYAMLPRPGGWTLLGVTDSVDGTEDGYALGLDADGEVVWMKRIGSDLPDAVHHARPAAGGQGDVLWVGQTESYGTGGRDAFFGRIRSDGEGGCKVRPVKTPWERRSAKLPTPDSTPPTVAHGAERRVVTPAVQSVPAGAAAYATDVQCLSPACDALGG